MQTPGVSKVWVQINQSNLTISIYIWTPQIFKVRVRHWGLSAARAATKISLSMSPVFLFKKLSNYHWPGNSFKGFFVFCNIYFFKNVLTEFYVHMEKVDITSYPRVPATHLGEPAKAELTWGTSRSRKSTWLAFDPSSSVHEAGI